MSELPKTYDPKSVEDKLYKFWVDSGFFHAEVNPDKKPYTIVIPPPNVTGQLHMGHAFDETLQDILIRTKRMQGYEALWMPGTDHAGIATQIKVEENLRKEEGLTRYDLGREEFLKRVWAWKDKFGNRIISQLKKLGTSCDWDRERFTMDEGCSKAVREVFVNLYNKGLIYKGHRIINWCPHCATALSDAEVEYETQPGKLWHIRYPLADGSGDLVVATTRPETFMGDTGVAVNPNDERYKHLIGKTCILPIMNREIPIFGDEYVDMEFGTGCVKVTPCHDPNDFEMGQRHNLEQILVFNEDATVNANGGKYEGMDRYECRKAVVKDLEEGGWLVKIEDHEHNVGTCYRCGTTVEPMTSAQWFVKMAPLAKPAMDVVNEGKTKFVPDRFSKTYLRWMENVHDWCISRQLWWGHRIPAFYCDDCGEMTVSKTDVCTCPKCGSKNIRQEEDVLDTWFSSALWPFSTLGWPDKTKELDYFYPTSTLVTGYDIIFFWVARMIFSGVEHMGETPFKTVYIHGLVRDAQGRKMSKSLGNGIDPLEVIAQYGADALRFMLLDGSTPGNDMRYSEKKVEAARNFANKLWNATRFVLMNLPEDFQPGLPEESKLDMSDKWVLTKLNQVAGAMTDNLDHFEMGLAAAKINSFIWDVYCDWFIEIAKPRLNSGDAEQADTARRVLVYVLDKALKLLHPFMPFITEELYQALPGSAETIMTQSWPTFDEAHNWAEEEEAFEKVMDYIKAVRTMRTEMNVHPAKKTSMIIETADPAPFRNAEVYLAKFAFATDVTFTEKYEGSTDGMVQVSTHTARGFIPMMELIDREKELARLNKEKAKAEKELAMFENQLANPKFVERAPAALVEEIRAKRTNSQSKLANIEQSIKALG